MLAYILINLIVKFGLLRALVRSQMGYSPRGENSLSGGRGAPHGNGPGTRLAGGLAACCQAPPKRCGGAPCPTKPATAGGCKFFVPFRFRCPYYLNLFSLEVRALERFDEAGAADLEKSTILPNSTDIKSYILQVIKTVGSKCVGRSVGRGAGAKAPTLKRKAEASPAASAVPSPASSTNTIHATVSQVSPLAALGKSHAKAKGTYYKHEHYKITIHLIIIRFKLCN